MNDVRRRKSEHGPVATETHLGWVLIGPTDVDTKDPFMPWPILTS